VRVFGSWFLVFRTSFRFYATSRKRRKKMRNKERRGKFAATASTIPSFRIIAPDCGRNLPTVETQPTVEVQPGRQFWWRPWGASLPVELESTTPFILERANPPKDGGAKLWAFGHSARTFLSGTDGRQAAEGVDW
jgi:hypothetical protein